MPAPGDCVRSANASRANHVPRAERFSFGMQRDDPVPRSRVSGFRVQARCKAAVSRCISRSISQSSSSACFASSGVIALVCSDGNSGHRASTRRIRSIHESASSFVASGGNAGINDVTFWPVMSGLALVVRFDHWTLPQSRRSRNRFRARESENSAPRQRCFSQCRATSLLGLSSAKGRRMQIFISCL